MYMDIVYHPCRYTGPCKVTKHGICGVKVVKLKFGKFTLRSWLTRAMASRVR